MKLDNSRICAFSVVSTLLFGIWISAGSEPRKPVSTGKPTVRPFRMGFTRWPSEISLAGIQQADQFLGKHADLVSMMFMGGIPWQEALEGTTFSRDIQTQLNYRRPEGYQLFLSISPLDMGRRKLAPYWGKKDNLPLPKEWAQQRFNSLQVIRAFTSFTFRCIQALKPDYLAIGIESNILLSNDRRAWAEYKQFHKTVYRAVKIAYPQLPVFFTTDVNHYLERAKEARGSRQQQEVAELMNYSDVFAMSCYPHMSYDTPWPIPDDFFHFARAIGKPIAVSETGMLSRPVTVFNLPLRGNTTDQKQYYDALLRSAARDNYLFVVTFATTDFEKLIAQIPREGRELASIWSYTGLQTSDGKGKPALEVWDSFLALPYRREQM
jgi:hypothetical protein